MRDLAPIVKAYDVRGVVPDELDEEIAHALGRAAAVELGGQCMVVGRDMRPSSPGLAAAFMAGVREQGVHTIDLGLTSTDLVYYASGRFAAPGAMFTASHNPAQYNGIKLCRAYAEPVSLETGLADIRDRAQTGDLPCADSGGGHRSVDLLADFASHVRGFVAVDQLRPLRVAVDAGNGMAAHVVPAVFDGLPFVLVPRCFELDGTFPNHPADPLDPANLADVQAAVVDEGCDVGLAFDGDADRVFVVDEAGRAVSPSIIAAIVAAKLLAHHPGETILYNGICSRVVRETIAQGGGRGVRTRTGHSYVKAVMAETDAIFAGEHSGHYYFRDNYRADSGLIAMLVLLEALSLAGGPMSALAAPYDRYVASGEINSTVTDAEAAVERVLAAFAGEGDVDRIDGLTVASQDWWLNVRSSNTEPLLRLNVEASDAETMGRIRQRVLEQIRPEGR